MYKCACAHTQVHSMCLCVHCVCGGQRLVNTGCLPQSASTYCLEAGSSLSGELIHVTALVNTTLILLSPPPQLTQKGYCIWLFFLMYVYMMFLCVQLHVCLYACVCVSRWRSEDNLKSSLGFPSTSFKTGSFIGLELTDWDTLTCTILKAHNAIIN